MKLSIPLTIHFLLTFLIASNAKRIGEASASNKHRELDVDITLPYLFNFKFGFDCFSSHATVDVKGSGEVRMDQVKVGDQVLTAQGNYKTIYSIDHRHPTKLAEFIQIHSSQSRPIELTEKHMLYLAGHTYPVPASTVKVGDQVQTLDGPRHVTKISTVTREGVFNPLTVDGTIVVNGIIASVYSAALSNHDWIEIAGHKIMTHQNFFHKALKSYRYMCTGVSLDLCKTNKERIAISEFASRAANYWARQGEMFQVLSLFFLIAFVCLVDVVLNPLFFGVSMIMIGWLITKKASKKKIV